MYGAAGLEAGLEVGHRSKTLAEITEQFERARAKEARRRVEATLNFRGAYGFRRRRTYLTRRWRARDGLRRCARGGHAAESFLDLNGVDFNSVFDVPLTEEGGATAHVGAQGQMSRGMGAVGARVPPDRVGAHELGGGGGDGIEPLRRDVRRAEAALGAHRGDWRTRTPTQNAARWG